MNASSFEIYAWLLSFWYFSNKIYCFIIDYDDDDDDGDLNDVDHKQKLKNIETSLQNKIVFLMCREMVERNNGLASSVKKDWLVIKFSITQQNAIYGI